MHIQFQSPLVISLSDIANHIPNSRAAGKSIYDRKTFKTIFNFSDDYSKFDTDFSLEELANIINSVPLSLTKDFILAMGKADIELPKLYQVALEKKIRKY